MDKGAWQATVHGVTKSQTRLSVEHTAQNIGGYFMTSGQGMISVFLNLFY